jgi:hypothetical protein
MSWLNESEIDEAMQMFAEDPLLGPAVRYLDEYRQLVDDNSDGWCYWGYGTKCADDLCNLIETARNSKVRAFVWSDPPSKPPTEAEIEKACRKIRTFMLRCKQWRKIGVRPPVLGLLSLSKE